MRIWRAAVAGALLLGGLTAASASAEPQPAQVRIAWVTVGGPGNAADTEVMASDRTCCYGAVPYVYRIGMFDVTNTEYAAFLNAVAVASDPYLLYDPCLDHSACYGVGSGILRMGAPGDYHYSAQPGREHRPVNYINLFDALRFANWMNNGQGDASTETGAYTLLGGTPVPANAFTVHRNPGAKIFLPDENEWYKAAYYDVALHRYYDYPAGTDTPMVCALPGPTPNTANCDAVTGNANPANPGLPQGGWIFNDVTDVGAYTGSPSPNGTFDQGGDVFQWTDDLTTAVTNQYQSGSHVTPLLDLLGSVVGSPYPAGVGPLAVIRGTDFGDSGDYNAANNRSVDFSADTFETYGFRLASAVPH